MPVENVSDTARWVAVYRAMETARSDALFRDPFAARLAGTQGEQIVDQMKKGRSLAWPMIVRTHVFDEIIMDRIANHGIDTVINLAAGLDTRPWRLPLLPSLRWFDVDLLGMTNYKAAAMREERASCEYEAIAADLTDKNARTETFARLNSGASVSLVISEGLLIYLTERQVGDLARDIATMSSARWWLIDLATPQLLRIINRHWGKALHDSAPFQFAPESGTAFFNEFGWREIEFHSGLEEAQRLHREMKFASLWRFLGKFSSAEKREGVRRMSGYVLLERIPTSS
ncbi:MAG: class I SAM-dependent methyltransferase [Gemmatimonadaceae bacterium]